MAYKTLLTVLTNPSRVQHTVAAAAQLSLVHDAHLDVLALGVDQTQVGYSFAGSGAVLMQVALERADADAKGMEAAAKAAMLAQSPTLRWSVEAAVTQLGALTELITQRARLCDLVVLARPYGNGMGPEAEAVVEAALFEGRAPVMVLPDSGLGANPLPRRIVVAWNQSAEAMTAVRKALPLLVQADRVNIVVIDPPTHGPERADPGGLLCQFLVRHGVPAGVSVLPRSLPRVTDMISRHVRDQGADLLVMGAYGHSRFREAILGGATRSMLEQADVPILMAH